jgi:GAF domain-containing protein
MIADGVMGEGFVVSDAVKAMLTRIVHEVASLTEAPMVALWLADEETASLRIAAVSNKPEDTHLPLITLAFGQGGVGWVAVERTPLEVDDVFTDARFLGREWWRRQALSSFLGLPVLHENRLLGVLALNSPRPLRLSVGTREQLNLLVDQAAHVIDGARLEAAAARQREELAAHRAALTARLRETSGILAVARVVGTTTDLTRALRLICRELGILTGADTVAAYLLDPVHHREIQPIAGYHVPEPLLARLAESTVSVEELRFSDALFSDRRAVWTDDAPGDIRFANSLFTRFPHQSALVIPLIVDEEISGGFYLVWWKQRRQFEREEIETLEAIGGQVGVLLRNARLRAALEHRTTRLRELVRINQILSSSLDRRAVLTEIARAASRLTGAPSVVFYVADPVKRTLEVGAFSNEEVAEDFPIRVLPYGRGAAGWIALHQRVLESSDVSTDSRFLAREWWERHELRSFYGVPVVLDGALVAVLALAGREPFRFGPDDEDLIDNFCRQAGLAIRNAELFAAERQAEALSAVAALANAAAHEINNPLTIVFGRLGLLVPHADPDVRQKLEVALAAAGRIRTIVERMMRITRLETLDLPDYLHPTLDIERSSVDPPSDEPQPPAT